MDLKTILLNAIKLLLRWLVKKHIFAVKVTRTVPKEH